MVGRQALDLLTGVRILSPQPLVPSSRGLGRGPLKAVTRVRIPLGLPIKSMTYSVSACLFSSKREENVKLSFDIALLNESTLRCA